MLITLR